MALSKLLRLTSLLNIICDPKVHEKFLTTRFFYPEPYGKQEEFRESTLEAFAAFPKDLESHLIEKVENFETFIKDKASKTTSLVYIPDLP